MTMNSHPLYELPHESLIPFFSGDDQLDYPEWSFKKGAVLLYLQDYDLTEKNLKADGLVYGPMEPSRRAYWISLLAERVARGGWPPSAIKIEEYKAVMKRVAEEFEKTGRIKGVMFLTPCLKKIWMPKESAGWIFHSSLFR